MGKTIRTISTGFLPFLRFTAARFPKKWGMGHSAAESSRIGNIEV